MFVRSCEASQLGYLTNGKTTRGNGRDLGVWGRLLGAAKPGQLGMGWIKWAGPSLFVGPRIFGSHAGLLGWARFRLCPDIRFGPNTTWHG